MNRKKVAIIIFALVVLSPFLIGGWIYFSINQSMVNGQNSKLKDAIADTSWVDQKDLVIYLTDNHELFMIQLDGEGKRKIAENVVEYDLSPDKDKILLQKRNFQLDYDDEKGRVFSLLNLKDLKEKLIEQKNDCDTPKWNPDSRKIIYLCQDGYEIKLFDGETNERKSLLTSSEMVFSQSLQWPSDSRSFFYQGLFSKRIFQFDLEKEIATELTEFPSRDRLKIEHSQRSSPLNRYVVVIKKCNVWLRTGNKEEEIVRCEYKGVYDPKFYGTFGPFEWTKDETYFLTLFNGVVYVVHRETKKLGVLTKAKRYSLLQKTHT